MIIYFKMYLNFLYRKRSLSCGDTLSMLGMEEDLAQMGIEPRARPDSSVRRPNWGNSLAGLEGRNIQCPSRSGFERFERGDVPDRDVSPLLTPPRKARKVKYQYWLIEECYYEICIAFLSFSE